MPGERAPYSGRAERVRVSRPLPATSSPPADRHPARVMPSGGDQGHPGPDRRHQEGTMSIPPMSSMDPSEQRSPMQTGGPDDSAWTGWIAFAGVVMVMLGIFHAIQGLVALFKDDYYAVHSSG